MMALDTCTATLANINPILIPGITVSSSQASTANSQLGVTIAIPIFNPLYTTDSIIFTFYLNYLPIYTFVSTILSAILSTETIPVSTTPLSTLLSSTKLHFFSQISPLLSSTIHLHNLRPTWTLNWVDTLRMDIWGHFYWLNSSFSTQI